MIRVLAEAVSPRRANKRNATGERELRFEKIAMAIGVKKGAAAGGGEERLAGAEDVEKRIDQCNAIDTSQCTLGHGIVFVRYKC